MVVEMNFSEQEVTKRKEIAVKASLEAGKVLLNNFGKVSHIKAKSDRNFVTDIDLKADEIITNKILSSFKNDNILSEEKPLPDFDSDYTWIIDPLDGTHNFIRNIDIFGVSVAVAFKEEVVAGVIYMPCSKELYTVQRGKGAFCNDKRINVSERDIKNTTMIYDSSIRHKRDIMLKGLGDLADKVFNVRMFGSTARSLAFIAEGKAELEVEFNDEVWDYAAGLLLVEEAGGMASDLEGNKWNIKTKGYIASNKIIYQEVLNILNKG